MLETIAAKIVGFGPLVLAAYLVGAIVAGFAIALIVKRKSKAELQRVPYFVFTMMFVVVGMAVSYTWLWSVRAAANDLLWVVVAINLFTWLLVGYGLGIIAAARSRDAFNVSLAAILALIPLLNLFLIFQPSREARSRHRVDAVPVPRGWPGALLGVLLIGMYLALNVGLDIQSEGLVEEAREKANAAKSMEFLIRARGLEGTLQLLAVQGNRQLPRQVDEITRLVTLSAEGKRFSRTYIVMLDEVTFRPDFGDLVARNLCSHEPFGPLLRKGAIIEEIYKEEDGDLIGKFPVTQETCDRLKS